MNLIYGEIVEIFPEEGVRMGRIRVGGALRVAALDLLADARRGDMVLLCDGVAINRVLGVENTEANHVSGHPR
jgi:hydrogenase maturation factor